jgi:hypothetical protein
MIPTWAGSTRENLFSLNLSYRLQYRTIHFRKVLASNQAVFPLAPATGNLELL